MKMTFSQLPSPIDFHSLKRIAVFRALQLGDLLCSVPALRSLRQAAPQAKITLIGLPWARDFAARYDRYIDDFIEFPGFPGLPESEPRLAQLPEFFMHAHSKRFDLAIQLHGSGGLSNPLTVALGAARNAGFYAEGQYCPDHASFMPWPDCEHEVLRYLSLLRFLGIDVPQDASAAALEFPLVAQDFADLHAAFAQAGAPMPAMGSYVCLHPGARLPSRRWAPERFAQVAHGLMAQGWQVILTGSKDERPIADALFAELARLTDQRPLDLLGRTSLGALSALVAGAKLVVCNDTGMSHIATAQATPSVIVCSGADPQRWAPLNHERHRLLYADVPCRPCAHVVCPIAGHPCADQVSVTAVLDEALRLCAHSPTPSHPVEFSRSMPSFQHEQRSTAP